MFYHKPLFMRAIDAPIQKVDHTLLFAVVAFASVIILALSLLIVFRKWFRKHVNLKIALPIIGALLLIIPFTEDYVNLVNKGQIDNFLSVYLSADNVIPKIVIYLVAFAFIFANKQSITAMSPLSFIILTLAIASKQESWYVFNVFEYASVLSSLLFVAIISRQRYSFINFIESMLVMAMIAITVVSIKVATASEIKDVKELKVHSFNLFYSYDGGWEQIVTWFAIVAAAQFTYLFLSTQLTFKLNIKETFSFIRLEDKYRKANIEFNFETEDDFSVELLLFESEEIDFHTDILFKEEFEGTESTQQVKLQKVYLKSKGIRSPSL